jgi:hypothetical protein
MKKAKTNFAHVIPFLSLIPFIVFLISKRLLCNVVEDSCPWSSPFFYAAGVAVAVIAIQVFFRIPLDRFLLAINVWLIGSAILFIINYTPLLLLMNEYKGSFFFLAFIVTGLISVLCLQGGFINLEKIDQRKNKVLSLWLLLGCIVAFIWSLIFHSSSIAFSLVLPLIALIVLYVVLAKYAKNI